ncbi:MAG: subunit of tubulin prefoldin [Trichoglossum hirsutum]|nr:MAG: subunit of tubulin prefoldin [Trichoglossum hirsutum]
MANPPKDKPQAVDLTSLSPPQLTSVKKQLDDELEHLTSSFAKLRTAQVKFQECLRTIRGGVDAKVKGTALFRKK